MDETMRDQVVIAANTIAMGRGHYLDVRDAEAIRRLLAALEAAEKRAAALDRLRDAARPFLSDSVVDVTDGTIPLMDRLRAALAASGEREEVGRG